MLSLLFFGIVTIQLCISQSLTKSLADSSCCDKLLAQRPFSTSLESKQFNESWRLLDQTFESPGLLVQTVLALQQLQLVWRPTMLLDHSRSCPRTASSSGQITTTITIPTTRATELNMHVHCKIHGATLLYACL